ncbi:unnamed protein product, partial [Ectocarpus fasciculatus]
DGELINSNPYDYGLDFREGMAAVVKDGQWGFILADGSVALEFCYEMTYGFKEGLSAAKHNDKWGFIDKQGAWVIEPVYDSYQFDLFDYSDGMLIVSNEEDRYGYLDEWGQL